MGRLSCVESRLEEDGLFIFSGVVFDIFVIVKFFSLVYTSKIAIF